MTFRFLTPVLLAVACACAPPAVGPAPQVDLKLTDDESAELIRELTVKVDEAPAEAARRAELGMALEGAGFWRAALESYEQARTLDPSEPRHTYFAAIAMAQLGDLAGALQALDDVLASHPDNVAAHLFRGHWSYDSGAYDEALEAFERAVGAKGLARLLRGGGLSGGSSSRSAVFNGAAPSAGLLPAATAFSSSRARRAASVT